ncbi:lipoprotein [Erysipelothrix piscisicarius]|nr:lipoprotein [Erysipelothrix piscisicarius]
MKRLSVFLVLLLILTGCSDTPENRKWLNRL